MFLTKLLLNTQNGQITSQEIARILQDHVTEVSQAYMGQQTQTDLLNQTIQESASGPQLPQGVDGANPAQISEIGGAQTGNSIF